MPSVISSDTFKAYKHASFLLTGQQTENRCFSLDTSETNKVAQQVTSPSKTLKLRVKALHVY